MGHFSLKKLGQQIGSIAGGVERQLNPLDAGLSYKTKVAAPQNRQQSSVQQAYNNFVKPVVQVPVQFSENYSNAFANLGNRARGGRNQTIQQNMGGNPFLNKTLQFSGATGKNKQLAGDIAQIGLTAAAPGISRAVETPLAAGFTRVAASRIATNLLPRMASNGLIAGGFNAANAAGNDASLRQTAKAFGQGAAVGMAFPVAGAAVKGGAKVALKAADNRVPLNQVGAVGKNVGKSKVTLKTTTGKQMTEAEFNKIVPAVKGTPQLTPQELADLPAKEQMALHAKDTPLVPAEVNTAKNPYKSSLTEVKQGDYKHAIQNSQLVSRPVETAANVWASSMKRLTPDEQANFWRAVEDPAKTNHSPALQDAIQQWRNVDNKVHGESQALGGNTNYLTDHGLHPWQLPEEYTNHVINGGSPSKFTGLNNISRKYRTIAEGEANGLTLGTDPIGEGTRYLRANAAILRKEALKQGLGAADSHMEAHPYTLDLGGGHTVALSKEGFNAAKGVQVRPPSTNLAVKGVRTVNAGLKSTILSLGQFHTINIGALRAAPTLIAEGHPVAAAKGLYGMFRGAFGTEYADRVIGKALADGTVDKAAQIGMPYGGSSYDVSGTFLKHGVGSRTVFGKQIPIMHDQVARSIISDLEESNIPLDSPQARDAGLAGANMMGELNHELENISPRVQRAMTDSMLAGQFTPSKFLQVKRAVSKGGVGGSYARANVLANVAATTAIITGLGYITKQKSDDLKDMLLRALLDPAVPTPMKDAKGNTVKLRLPGTDTSDVAKLLGIKIVRNTNGHLGASWHGFNLNTAADFGRARLSPLLSAGVKIKTNSTFASKPLYDPNAPAGTKAIQGATSLVIGDLPIGLQGVAYTNAVKNHVPGSAKEVLDAQTPGTNPIAKSIGSSFGLTPSTDMTTGKGLDETRYFGALDKAKQGLNRQEKDVLDLYSGSKKNPVTGKYDVMPSVNDARTKAATLLQNPKVIDRLISMNQTLGKQGGTVDPLWQRSKDQITKYLQYQSMPPGSADKTDWYNKNGKWYGPLVDQRNAFFDSLPKGDPNKPKLDLQYPDATPAVKSSMDAYANLTDAKQKAAFLDSHPDVIKQWNAQANYTNKLREALGYSPLKNYPEATPQLQKFIDQYSGSDKATKKGIRNANSGQYQKMIAYFDSLDLYNIGKQASVSQLQGEPDYTSKEAKAMSNLAKDIYQNPDGTYSIVPAGWMNGLKNGSGGFGGGSGGKGGRKSVPLPYAHAVPLSAGGKAARPKVSVKLASAYKSSRGKVSKPKVSIKKSTV